LRSERVLVWLKPKYIGDAIMATPLLSALAQEFDRPVVLAAPHVAELLERDSDGLEIVPPGPLKSPREVAAEAQRLRAMRFDAVLLVNRSFRSAFTAWLARIPKRIGHATEGRGVFLSKRIPYGKLEHEGISYGNLARPLGIACDFTRIRLTTTEAEREEGKRLLDGATVGIQPGASYFTKQLPTAVLAEIVNSLQAEGLRVACFGGGLETADTERLQELVEQPLVNLVGKTTIRQTLGAAANLRAMLAPSSGMMHMAAAVGCPTVAVFGPDPATKWGHTFPPHTAIQISSERMEDIDQQGVLTALHRALETPNG
jgi:heptosyltransferase II